jgi:fused signal recognition particle receptor
VLLVVGVNGVGKTTSIAKLARAAQKDGRSVLLAAGDTFRAGAIEQLKVWGERLGAPVIAHKAGSDPGAVAFDALSAARARGADMVIIDTAGRLHTRHNLMEELRKVRGIVDRDGGGFLKRALLVIDGTTGQNGLAQAKAFMEATRCDAVLLSKLDGTAKGGIALAIAGELGLPVAFIGTGETVDDLFAFDPAGFAEAVLPDPRPAAA